MVSNCCSYLLVLDDLLEGGIGRSDLLSEDVDDLEVGSIELSSDLVLKEKEI